MLKFDVIDDEGEVRTVEHTSDVLVITQTAIWLEEWKPWGRVTKRASRFPWRYLEQEGRWVSRPVENWLGERGIGYRILTDRDVLQARVEDLLMLEDYFAFDSPVRGEAPMLSRRAYGFRNFENYRMRVLAQCGWNGVINRV